MLNTGLFIRYFVLTSLIASLVFFLASFRPAPGGLTEDILKYTNQFRQSRGLKALEIREDLSKIAKKHSEDMAKGKRSFGHEGFEQRTQQIRRMYESAYVAENVAYGATTGIDVVTQWKSSKGHRQNLLGDYRYIGIGTARDRSGRIYYTQLFVR